MQNDKVAIDSEILKEIENVASLRSKFELLCLLTLISLKGSQQFSALDQNYSNKKKETGEDTPTRFFDIYKKENVSSESNDASENKQ